MQDEYEDREQSYLKHFALNSYLAAASRIIGSWNDFSYIDCCSGPWGSRSATFEDTSFGICVKVLKESKRWLRGQGKNPRFRALLIEKDATAYRQLESFAANASDEDTDVQCENWDFRNHIPDIVKFAVSPPSFSFIFIDPKGWTLADVSKLEPLLRLRPGEILINFMSSFIVRFINDDNTNLDDILGSDYREMRRLESEEREDEAVRRYCERIRLQGGFKYVCSLPVMKKDQDAIHFHLIYGTRHEKGVQVFKEVERKTEKETAVVRAERQQSQRSILDLFDSDVLYRREERYKRLSSRNRSNAREALNALIEKRGTVPYDVCWAETLQFPAVYESDLREWLGELESAGVIRVEGRKRTNEVLKRKSNHAIAKCG